MKKIKRFYKPGKKITLFNYKKDKFCQGELLFPKLTEVSSFFSDRGYGISLPAAAASRNFFFSGVAIGLLFISVFIFTNLVLPISSAYLEIAMTKLPGSIKPKTSVKPVNLYSESFILDEDNKQFSNEFKLFIPKLDIESDVIPNVDASNEGKYLDELKKGIAHAAASYLPGQNGPVVLFAHSTDTVFNIEQYNAKFYALKNIEIDDEVTIYFRGNKYKYRVVEKKIIDPNDLNSIRNSTHSLILSTCWPPGTNWQRILVSADLQEISKLD